MNIIEALQITDIRLTNYDKWLLFNNGNWCVYQKKKHAKNTVILIETMFEEEAVKQLLKED